MARMVFALKPKQTRSGLIVSAQARRRSIYLGLMSLLITATPYPIAILRENYLNENLESFVRWYSIATVLVALCCPIVWVLSGQSLAGMFTYSPKGSPAGKLNKVLNIVLLAVPITGNLYVAGLPQLLKQFLVALAPFGHGLPSLVANGISCAISGIIGN